MKVGEYCRTDKGKIGKIVHFEPRDKYPYSYDRVILDTEGYKRTTRNIIKCSPNIIDLIEVGDYVNGCLVTNKRASANERLSGHPKQIFILKQEGNYYDGHFEWLGEENIKSIVTREQFKSIEYKVKE